MESERKEWMWGDLAPCSEQGEILPVDPSNPKRGYFVPQAAAQKWLDFTQHIPVEIPFAALKSLPYFQKGASSHAPLVILKVIRIYDTDQIYSKLVLYMNERAFTALQKFNRKLTPVPALPPMTSLPPVSTGPATSDLLTSDFMKALLDQAAGMGEPKSSGKQPPGSKKSLEPK